MKDLIERDAMLSLIASMPGAGTTELYNAAAKIPTAVASGTKPSIDWDHVAEGLNWLVRDEDKEVYLFENRPDQRSFGWCKAGSEEYCVATDMFSSYTPGTCDWKDSLVMRPGHTGE